MTSAQITSLMRRINALEAGVSGFSGGVYQRKWGSFGSGTGQFNSPHSLDATTGTVYVADSSNNRVQAFSTAGVYQSNFSSPGPRGICVGGGEIYVCEYSSDTVSVYNTSGVLQRSWASNRPLGICYLSGELYVSNYLDNTVSVYNTSGTLQRSWGSPGSGNGQFNSPGEITSYAGEIYVTDQLNVRVQVFDTAGIYQRKWSVPATGDPYGISVSNGFVFVSTAVLDFVYVYRSDGTYITSIGGPGVGDGQFSVCLGCSWYNNELYVVDGVAHRVQVFSANTSSLSQTEFHSYTTTAATSLGTPDGGVSVPATNALKPAPDGNNADLIPRHIIDMRTAIETLAPYFTNAITGNPFNWTASSADNLYYVALGDRSHYGATGGAKYDWTRTEAQMEGDYCYSIDIGEIADTITLLEAS